MKFYKRIVFIIVFLCSIAAVQPVFAVDDPPRIDLSLVGMGVLVYFEPVFDIDIAPFFGGIVTANWPIAKLDAGDNDESNSIYIFDLGIGVNLSVAELDDGIAAIAGVGLSLGFFDGFMTIICGGSLAYIPNNYFGFSVSATFTSSTIHLSPN